MRRAGARFAVVAIAGVIGCAPAKVTSSAGRSLAPTRAAEPGFVSLLKGPDSQLLGAVGEVIRDSSRWHAVWGLIPRSNPLPPVPYVDFGREMLVMAAGPTGGPGDSVVIERVKETSTQLHVLVVAYQECSPAQQVTQPYHVVRVRRSAPKPVFESQFVRGPNCIPAEADQLKITRHPATGIVPLEPPDTVPSWAHADSSFAGPSQYIPLRFIRDIVGLEFRKEATQHERQRAVDLVSGTVIGGYPGIGIYLVQVDDPGDGSVIMRVAEMLRAMPFVASAGPNFEFGPQ